jgi:hypothetical protein
MARSSRRTHEEHTAAQQQAERQEVRRRLDDGETIAQIAKGMRLPESRVRELKADAVEARVSTEQTSTGVWPIPQTPAEERHSGVEPASTVPGPEPEPSKAEKEDGKKGDDARR